MGYMITSNDGECHQAAQADTAKGALIKARQWEAAGEKNIRVTGPDGEAMSLHAFEIFSLGITFGGQLELTRGLDATVTSGQKISQLATIPEAERAPESVELDAGHWLEALQSTHIAQTVFEQHVYDHPAVAQTPELRAKAEAILTALGELYQSIGAEGRSD